MTDTRLTGLLNDYRTLVQSHLRRLGVEAGRAEDAAQEVFVIVARKLELIQPGCEKSYLLAVSNGVAANYRRAQATRRELCDSRALEDAVDPAPAADRLIDHKRARACLDKVLNAMPGELRRVLVSFELEGLSMPQIAEQAGTPVGTVASRLRRARRTLDRVALRHARSLMEG
jgi:RNA polymerase sigma-70 factor (ECF subfamily)